MVWGGRGEKKKKPKYSLEKVVNQELCVAGLLISRKLWMCFLSSQSLTRSSKIWWVPLGLCYEP